MSPDPAPARCWLLLLRGERRKCDRTFRTKPSLGGETHADERMKRTHVFDVVTDTGRV